MLLDQSRCSVPIHWRHGAVHKYQHIRLVSLLLFLEHIDSLFTVTSLVYQAVHDARISSKLLKSFPQSPVNRYEVYWIVVDYHDFAYAKPFELARGSWACLLMRVDLFLFLNGLFYFYLVFDV